MTTAPTRTSPDLSPSGARSLSGLFARPGATWREAMEGSAVGLGVLVGLGLGVLSAVVRRRRQRRGH